MWNKLNYFIHLVPCLPFTVAMLWGSFLRVCHRPINSNIHPWFTIEKPNWCQISSIRNTSIRRQSNSRELSIQSKFSLEESICYITDVSQAVQICNGCMLASNISISFIKHNMFMSLGIRYCLHQFMLSETTSQKSMLHRLVYILTLLLGIKL